MSTVFSIKFNYLGLLFVVLYLISCKSSNSYDDSSHIEVDFELKLNLNSVCKEMYPYLVYTGETFFVDGKRLDSAFYDNEMFRYYYEDGVMTSMQQFDTTYDFIIDLEKRKVFSGEITWTLDENGRVVNRSSLGNRYQVNYNTQYGIDSVVRIYENLLFDSNMTNVDTTVINDIVYYQNDSLFSVREDMARNTRTIRNCLEQENECQCEEKRISTYFYDYNSNFPERELVKFDTTSMSKFIVSREFKNNRVVDYVEYEGEEPFGIHFWTVIN